MTEAHQGPMQKVGGVRLNRTPKGQLHACLTCLLPLLRQSDKCNIPALSKLIFDVLPRHTFAWRSDQKAQETPNYQSTRKWDA
eukprot:6136570-Amphidinium_carterae.1